jgi:hypothetical protein
LLLLQFTTRPVSTFPAPSETTTLNCVPVPTDRLLVGALILTDATGTWTTVMVTEDACPSLVAVIVAEPALAPVTSPVPFTAATDGPLLLQVIVWPVITAPLASRVTAVSCVDPPTEIVVIAAVTVTVATVDGALTLSATDPVAPSLVAEIVAAPGATAATIPDGDTVATLFALLVQVTGRSGRGLPVASRGTAASCTAWPTRGLVVGAVIAIDATAASTEEMSVDTPAGHAVSVTRRVSAVPAREITDGTRRMVAPLESVWRPDWHGAGAR